jgi:DNA-binding MarR family transcriptional regulator
MTREHSLGYHLGRALRSHKRRSHQLMSDLGLHPGQTPIMFALWRQDGEVQKDLANSLHLTPPTLSVTLQRLEKAGLVCRKKDSADQRVSRVYLTEQGWQLKEQVMQCIRETDELCFRGFSPQEEDLLIELLDRITDNLTDEE